MRLGLFIAVLCVAFSCFAQSQDLQSKIKSIDPDWSKKLEELNKDYLDQLNQLQSELVASLEDSVRVHRHLLARLDL